MTCPDTTLVKKYDQSVFLTTGVFSDGKHIDMGGLPPLKYNAASAETVVGSLIHAVSALPALF